MEALFTQALGLSAPWQVIAIDFQKGNGCIVFQVENTAKRLPCPACGASDQPIYDRLERSWEHLHFFQYKALIKARIPRVACTKCELTRQVAVPWARKNSGFSQVMEAFINLAHVVVDDAQKGDKKIVQSATFEDKAFKKVKAIIEIFKTPQDKTPFFRKELTVKP